MNIATNTDRIENATSDSSTLSPIYTEREAAQLLKISVPNLRRRRMEGRPPRYTKLGTLVRYTASDLLA
jgi:hypothetical protein